MGQNDADPVEERDVQKLLAMLEDERILDKLAEKIALKLFPQSGNIISTVEIVEEETHHPGKVIVTPLSVPDGVDTSGTGRVPPPKSANVSKKGENQHGL